MSRSGVAAVEQHNAEEATISPEQMDAAVKAVQKAFLDTYGEAALKEATTHPSAWPDACAETTSRSACPQK
jgi:hypothetical protein